MNGLKCSREEAEDVYAYDKEIDSKDGDPSLGVLPPEKELVARKATHAGVRETKKPFIPDLKPRQRKPNATKEGLVSELARFIENSEFATTNLQVPNPQGKVSFKIGDKWYTWALTEHRTKPKWCEEGGGNNSE